MKIHVTRCLILAGAACLLCAAADAQAIPPWRSYAVKWVCGNVDGDGATIAADGRYHTTVNIHNPHYLKFEDFDLPVVFLKKIVLARPQGEDPLPPSCWLQEVLFADQALAVTCKNIKNQLALSGLPSTGVLEGFVVLVVPPGQEPDGDPQAPELDVTALYTGRSRAAGADVRLNGVSTWDVETVDFTAVRGSPVPLVFCD